MTPALQRCPLCAGDAALAEVAVEDVYFGFEGRWDYYRCQSDRCRVAFPVPFPDDVELDAAYRVYYTHDQQKQRPAIVEKFLARSAAWILARRHDARTGIAPLDWLAEELRWDYGGIPPLANGTLVDIGTGNGERLPLLRSAGWGRTIGVESDPVAVAHARGEEVRAGMAEALPCDDAIADAAMMHHVIEHVRDPKKAFAEAHRVLKPGGRLVILTPNFDSEARQRSGRYWRGFEAPRHLFLFSVHGLRNLVGDCGFTIEIGRTSARSSAWVTRVSEAAASGKDAERLSAPATILNASQTFARHERSARNSGDEIVLVARRT